MRSRHYLLLSSCAALLVGAFATTADASYRASTEQTWGTTNLTVCWDDTSLLGAASSEAQRVRATAEAAYHPRTRIRFLGWNNCGEIDTNTDLIRISIRGSGATSGTPPQRTGLHQAAQVILTLDLFRPLAVGQVFDHAVVHELGHAVGLQHEHARNDTPARCRVPGAPTTGTGAFENKFGPYDPDSVMGDCRIPLPATTLSQGDVNTINDWYGWPGDYLVAADGSATRYHDEVVAGAVVHQKCRIVSDTQYGAFDGGALELPRVTAPPAGVYVDTGDCVWPPKLYRLADNTTWFLRDFSAPACRLLDDVQVRGYGGGRSSWIFAIPDAALTTGRPAPTDTCHGGYPFRTRIYRLAAGPAHVFTADPVQAASLINFGGYTAEPAGDYYVEARADDGRTYAWVTGGYLWPSELGPSGAQALYGAYSPYRHDYFFTLSGAEAAFANLAYGYQFYTPTGVIGYAYAGPEDLAPVTQLAQAAAHGGGGGGRYALWCGEGKVAVGLFGTADTYVHSVGLYCKQLGLGGVIGAARDLATTSQTASTGTAGGPAFQAWCGNGEVLVGLGGRSGSYVDQLRLICAPLLGWAPGVTPRASVYAAGGGGGSSFEDPCQGGAAIIGLAGRSGATIDLAQATCQQLP